MPQPKKNIEESELPAKVWQFDSLNDKLDALSTRQEEVVKLIKDQSHTYPTRNEIALELSHRDNEIAYLKRVIANYTKFLWILATAVIPTIGLSIIQLVVNGMKLK